MTVEDEMKIMEEINKEIIKKVDFFILMRLKESQINLLLKEKNNVRCKIGESKI